MKLNLLATFALGVLLASMCSPVLLGAEPAPKVPPIGQLQAALELSDPQVEELARLRQERIATVRRLRESHGTQENRRRLRELLQQETSPEASVVGELVLAIEFDEQQIRKTNAWNVEASRNVLNDEQKRQLRRLRQALRLLPAAKQAIVWDLIPAPRKP